MQEVSKGHEMFIKGKKINLNGKSIFNKVIKKNSEA